MPIRRYLGDNRSFGPEDLDTMGKAFYASLTKLRLSVTDPKAEMVAARIIRAALAGERDRIRLTEIGAGGRE